MTELDLSDRKLRRFPDELLSFTRLRTLSLTGNKDLGALSERLGALTALEELNVADTGLTTELDDHTIARVHAVYPELRQDLDGAVSQG